MPAPVPGGWSVGLDTCTQGTSGITGTTAILSAEGVTPRVSTEVSGLPLM